MNNEVRDLYLTYRNKKVIVHNTLEIVTDFVLDLINVFGDTLTTDNPLKDGWRTFAPFEYILSLNQLLAKLKDVGYYKLDDVEKELLADHSLLLGGLVRAALTNHPDSFPDEEHFQIPDAVATDLLQLAGN
jgi:hypothetical protein